MTTNRQYYLARADENAREAGNSSLANVRERHLRSEAVWRAMAARQLERDDMRTATDIEKKDATA
jgi:hypothetical protein